MDYRPPAPTRARLLGALLALSTFALAAAEPPAEPEPDPAAAPVEPSPPAPVPPGAAERALAERFEAGTLGDDFERLGEGSDGFLVRYAPAHDALPRGAVLILPGYAGRISDNALIDALLTELPAGDWSALAVQPPLPPRESGRDVYSELAAAVTSRLEVALARLAADGIERVVLFSVAGEEAWARHFLANAATAGRMTALALYRAWDPGEDDRPLLPVLEFVGETQAQARDAARARQRAARRDGRLYRVVLLPGSAPDAPNAAALVPGRLRGWLHALEEAGALAQAAAGAPAGS